MSIDPWNTTPAAPPRAPSSRKRRRRRLWTLLAALGAAAVIVVATWAVTTSSSSAAIAGTSSTVPTAATTAATSQTPASTATTGHVNSQADQASPAQGALAKAYTSVVNISVTASAGRRSATGIGSGVIYTSDGYILTNDHVVTLDGAVSSGQSITVTFSDKSTAQATIVGEDVSKDIAVIKVNKTGLTPVTFGSSSAVLLGEWATVIGSPLDYQNSVSLGIVSGLDRSLQISTSQTLTGLMQIDAAISPGNSGGGCFDAEGHFIGMPELYLPPGSTGAENIGFAIPADVVASVAHTLTGK